MAEREGFEPSVEILSLRRFSKPLPSATRPPLRIDVLKGRQARAGGACRQGRKVRDEAQYYLKRREWYKSATRLGWNFVKLGFPQAPHCPAV
jgi:hypothetical protein